MCDTSKRVLAQVPAAADTKFSAQDTLGGSDMNSLVRAEIPSIGVLYLLIILPEFDFRTLGDGRSASARYANNSNYRNDSLIRKESRFGLLTGKHSAKTMQCVSVHSLLRRLSASSRRVRS